ncbi:MAG: hypothetical protein P8X65_04990 [Syntrophobacterales bacterium]
MQENALPIELAHKEQFFLILRKKRFEGEFLAGEPIYGKGQVFSVGGDVEVGLIFLYQRHKQVKGKSSGVGVGLMFVFFSLPDFKLFLGKSR